MLLVALFQTRTAATPTLEMQGTLIFSGSTCINQFYRASLRRASANRMNAISAPSPRAFTAPFACPRFSICARAKPSLANQSGAAAFPLPLFGHSRRAERVIAAAADGFEPLYESVACGPPLRRAYRPQRRRGRVAEGGGLLNRYRVVKPYRGFESLRLRQAPSLPLRRPRRTFLNYISPLDRCGRGSIRPDGGGASRQRPARDGLHIKRCRTGAA